MGKYYVVKVGKKPGIYKTWDECKEQTHGFKGAVYKSFTSEEEAKSFFNGETNNAAVIDIATLKTYSFVDGSFNSKTNVYGCGGFLYHKNDNGTVDKVTIQDSGNDPEMAGMRNVAGEILGSRRAIEKAIKFGYPELYIFYDYAGIENWATGIWERKKEGTKAYYEFIQSIKDKIQLHFVKVKGHSGIAGNEEADKLAKESVGIYEDE